jgi:hypothetical protein
MTGRFRCRHTSQQRASRTTTAGARKGQVVGCLPCGGDQLPLAASSASVRVRDLELVQNRLKCRDGLFVVLVDPGVGASLEDVA